VHIGEGALLEELVDGVGEPAADAMTLDGGPTWKLSTLIEWLGKEIIYKAVAKGIPEELRNRGSSDQEFTLIW
jgi:hypothetical protein